MQLIKNWIAKKNRNDLIIRKLYFGLLPEVEYYNFECTSCNIFTLELENKGLLGNINLHVIKKYFANCFRSYS